MNQTTSNKRTTDSHIQTIPVIQMTSNENREDNIMAITLERITDVIIWTLTDTVMYVATVQVF